MDPNEWNLIERAEGRTFDEHREHGACRAELDDGR